MKTLFKEGDRVRRKTPVMKVIDVADDQVICEWEEDGELRHQTFAASDIQKDSSHVGFKPIRRT
jgi:hypothetical protein